MCMRMLMQEPTRICTNEYLVGVVKHNMYIQMLTYIPVRTHTYMHA